MYSLADIASAVVTDMHDRFEATEADGTAWFTRIDHRGDVRTMAVSDSSLILDTRDDDGEPVPGTEVVNITNPSVLTVYSVARELF
jgi:hypothetical protein